MAVAEDVSLDSDKQLISIWSLRKTREPCHIGCQDLQDSRFCDVQHFVSASPRLRYYSLMAARSARIAVRYHKGTVVFSTSDWSPHIIGVHIPQIHYGTVCSPQGPSRSLLPALGALSSDRTVHALQWIACFIKNGSGRKLELTGT